jgi:hypothetical protein
MKCWLVGLALSCSCSVNLIMDDNGGKMGVNNWTSTVKFPKLLRLLLILSEHNEPSFIQMRQRRLWLFNFHISPPHLCRCSAKCSSPHKLQPDNSHITLAWCWRTLPSSFHTHLVGERMELSRKSITEKVFFSTQNSTLSLSHFCEY